MLLAVFGVLDLLLSVLTWIIIIQAILSWLVAFNVINTHNRFVYLALDVLNRLTAPALRPIRRLLPNLGGIDISPVILILLLYFVRDVLYRLAVRLV